MAETMQKKEILGPIELLKESFQLFFQGKNLAYLLKVTFTTLGIELLPIFATVLPFVVLGAISGSGKELGGGALVLIPLGLVGAVVTLAAFLWAQIAMVKAVQNVVNGQITPVGELLRQSWSGKVWQLLLLQLLTSLIVGFGILLLIIPGIIFGVWFAFAMYVLILENRGVTEALGRSKELVRGHFWTVLGYNLLFGIIMMIIAGFLQMVVPFVGSLIVMVFSSFYSFFPLLLYRELVKVSPAKKS